MHLYRLLLLLVFIVASPEKAFSADVNENLWNAVKFDETGNNVIVDLDAVRSNLELGADPNWRHEKYDKRTTTLNHYIVTTSHHQYAHDSAELAIKLLFEYGAKLGGGDESILYFPIVCNWKKMVVLLLENGAKADTFPVGSNIGSNISPLELAIENDNLEIANTLMKYGAKKIDDEEQLRLQCMGAARDGDVDSLKKIITEQGDSIINDYDRQRRTVLCAAVDQIFYDINHVQTVRYLLGQGADPNKRAYIDGSSLWTYPLHIAVHKSSVVIDREPDDIPNYRVKDAPRHSKIIIELLLSGGAHVSGADSNGATPLHVAAENNNMTGAKLLIDAGAKIMSKDNEGKTPLDYAESASMIQLLKNAGAVEI